LISPQNIPKQGIQYLDGDAIGAMKRNNNSKLSDIRGPTMQMSIHYYVLLLSGQTSRLYEGFREKFIDIEDSNFPFKSSFIAGKPSPNGASLREFIRQTDERFAHYFKQDPLRLIVIGEKRIMAIFEALTAHKEIIIGKVEGNYLMTSLHDLGMIVWPVVKEVIAGVNKNAIRDLVKAEREKKIVSGINNVGLAAETEINPTLYVEDDYHVRGSILKSDQAVIFSKRLNLLDVLDDVVDFIIEKVLKMGGTVIFLDNDSLKKLKRIALVLSG
jgi:hypothetical protein